MEPCSILKTHGKRMSNTKIIAFVDAALKGEVQGIDATIRKVVDMVEDERRAMQDQINELKQRVEKLERATPLNADES